MVGDLVTVAAAAARALAQHFGLVSCRELIPDLDALAGYLVDELEVLLKAADQRADG